MNSQPEDHAKHDHKEIEHRKTLAAIREGIADDAAGRTQPARPALLALAKKYGIKTTR